MLILILAFGVAAWRTGTCRLYAPRTPSSPASGGSDRSLRVVAGLLVLSQHSPPAHCSSLAGWRTGGQAG